MKKLAILAAALYCLAACASIEEAKNFTNCKYAMRSVEVADYNIHSLSFDIYIAITNLNRKTAAAIKKFDGKLTMNDIPVADVTFADVRVEPNTTKTQKAHVTVPMKNFNGKLLGLVSMGSATVDYHLVGTAYFETPLGDIPIPVDIGRRGSSN